MVIVVGLVTALYPSVLTAGMLPVDLTRIEPASRGGLVGEPDKDIGIRGKIYGGCLQAGWSVDPTWATWHIPDGYSRLEGFLGQDDETRYGTDKPVTLNVLVDGDLVKSLKNRPGQKALQVAVPVRPGASLRLELGGPGSVFAEPRLISTPADKPPGLPSPVPPGEPTPSAFVVDPRDVDKLAANLRQKADATPAVRQRVANGQVAVSTFGLIDIPSPSVAQSVAEDLYTAMINSGFALVERGQLDKVLVELKIQNMGLVDPKTAQRIGQLSGCDVILLGSISDRGQFVVINARLMDTATGKSLVADRVEMRKIAIQRGE
jgi:TolB-like protein